MHAHFPSHSSAVGTFVCPLCVTQLRCGRGSWATGQESSGGGGGFFRGCVDGEVAHWECLCSLRASMREKGLSAAGGAGRTSMAVKLLFWELEKHLKR